MLSWFQMAVGGVFEGERGRKRGGRGRERERGGEECVCARV